MKASNVLAFRDVKITSTVPEPSQEECDRPKPEPEFVSVKKLSQTYGISKSLIYELIQEERSFPATNIGKKKKYVIHLNGFKEWFKNRQRAQEAHVPTAFDLIRRHGK